MIQASQDFTSSLEFLASDFSADIRQMSGTMSSSDFNATWQYVEYELDLLYEKMRVLEDCLDYVKKTLDEDIKTRRSQLEEKMKTIENHAESYLNHSFVAKTVSFADRTGKAAIDRDGNYLPGVEIFDNAACLPTALIESYKNETCIRSGGYVPYRAQPKNLTEQKPYRSFYVLAQPADNGIIDTIKCVFIEPVNTSRINIEPIGCVIEELYVTTAGGVKKPVSPNRDFTDTRIISMEAKISCRQPRLCQFYQCTKLADESIADAGFGLLPDFCLEDAEAASRKISDQRLWDAYYQSLAAWQESCAVTNLKNKKVSVKGA